MSIAAARAILGTVPMFQSVAVASPSMRLARRGLKGKKISVQDMLGTSVTTITGTSLMIPTATQIAAF